METIKRKTETHRIRKPVTDQPMVSTNVAEELMRFAEYHPAARFKKNMRKMLLEFLMSEGGVEKIYLNDLLYDLEGLFELLDVIEEEEQERNK